MDRDALEAVRRWADEAGAAIDGARGTDAMIRTASRLRGSIREYLALDLPPTVRARLQNVADRLSALRQAGMQAREDGTDRGMIADRAAGAVDALRRLIQETNGMLRSGDTKMQRTKGRPGFTPDPVIVNERAAPRGYEFAKQWLFVVNQNLGVMNYPNTQLRHRIGRGYMKPEDAFYEARTVREVARLFARTFSQLEKFGFMTNQERLLARRVIQMYPSVTDAVGRMHRAVAAGNTNEAVRAADEYTQAAKPVFDALRAIQDIAYSRGSRKAKSMARKDAVIDKVRLGSGLLSALDNLQRAQDIRLEPMDDSVTWALNQLAKDATLVVRELTFLRDMAQPGSYKHRVLNNCLNDAKEMVRITRVAMGWKVRPSGGTLTGVSWLAGRVAGALTKNVGVPGSYRSVRSRGRKARKAGGLDITRSISAAQDARTATNELERALNTGDRQRAISAVASVLSALRRINLDVVAGGDPALKRAYGIIWRRATSIEMALDEGRQSKSALRARASALYAAILTNIEQPLRQAHAAGRGAPGDAI